MDLVCKKKQNIIKALVCAIHFSLQQITKTLTLISLAIFSTLSNKDNIVNSNDINHSYMYTYMCILMSSFKS